MVRLALLAVLASSRIAAAECELLIIPDRADETHDSVLGLTANYGKLPIDGRALQVTSFGLTYERRIHRRWRAFAQYDHVWLGVRDDERERQDVIDGSGDQLLVGIRRTLLASRLIDGDLRFYVDAEAGGGVMLATEPEAGRIFEPIAFAGVRFGYDFVHRFPQHAQSSTVWEPEITLRAIALDGGAGLVFGVGIGWGK